MTETVYPEDWNHESQFQRHLIAMLSNADCCWLQAITDLGFVLASVIVACEDEEYRKAVGELIAEKIAETARTGILPGEVMQ